MGTDQRVAHPPLADSDTLTCAHVPHGSELLGQRVVVGDWQVEVRSPLTPGVPLSPSAPLDQSGQGVLLTSEGCRTCAGVGACRARHRMWATARPGSETGALCPHPWGVMSRHAFFHLWGRQAAVGMARAPPLTCG